ncbi:MAG: VOC family protein [Planctomycetes bacterium]|nr:VOC family protein [Planctomycetota bacterium]
MYTGLTPMLICSDVQASIKFYEEALGLEVTNRMDDVGKTGWASMGKDGIHLMLASPEYFPEMPKVQDRYFQAQYYFYVDDLEGLREHIVSKGYEPTGIIEQSYGMREVEMPDPDGHILIFGQDMKKDA